MVNYQYAYLLGNLLLLGPFWLLLFILRKDLRKEILVVSVVIGFIGPLSELLYIRDYWRPELFNGWRIGIEDFLFGFFAGGSMSVVYEEVFRKKIDQRKNKRHRWSLFLVPLFILHILFVIIPTYRFNINSIYSSIVTFIFIALIIWCFRKDLVIDSLASGTLSALLMLGLYLSIPPDFSWNYSTLVDARKYQREIDLWHTHRRNAVGLYCWNDDRSQLRIL